MVVKVATPLTRAKGQLIKQTYDTMYDMVELAMKRGWAGIEIVDGTPIMKWAAWAIAKEKGLLPVWL